MLFNIDGCAALHRWAHALPLMRFPFDVSAIPKNGIYLLFEEGEISHGVNRIVRIGTHTGDNQLRSRLRQHFIMENKDRSILRKNIGRALLNRRHDPFLADWELDLTPAAVRKSRAGMVDWDQLKAIEREVTEYIQSKFSFVVVAAPSKDQRLRLESRMISTISRCLICRPSPEWLGHCSPTRKIRESGLWLVNELYKEPMDEFDLHELQRLS